MTSRGLLAGLLDRELTGTKRFCVPGSYTHAFSCSGQHAGVIKVDPDGDPCPPYAITYNQAAHGSRFLTVGDEEGCVSIVDTSAETLPDSLYTDTANPPRAKWLAHNNTIFDLAWAKNDSVLYTASGDQHVGVWDTTAGRLKMYCSGHDGSVKVVTPHTSTHDIFASGSRDGGILLWDLRVPTSWSASRRRMQLQPVGRINIITPAAHHHTSRPASAGAAGGTPGSGSKAGGRGRAGAARRSVTSLLFLPQDGHTLVSSSDMDGTVKLWDLRSLTTPTLDITLPPGAAAAAAAAGEGRGVKGRGRCPTSSVPGARGNISVWGAAWLSFSCPGRANRPAGITNMALSPSGDSLLVSSIEGCHYLYRLSKLDGPPVSCFSGHRAGSFCVKACFSPCGDYLLSGSSDSKAYVWQVSQPSLPPVSLSGHHDGEVTAVAWCPQDHCQLATAADDATVRVWNMDRSNSTYQRQFDHFNYSFADTHADPLWARCGVGVAAGAAADADAALGTTLSGLQLQQQQQLVRANEEAEEQVADMQAVGPALGQGAAKGEAGVTPCRGDRPLQQRSICSPITPQLPFWRARGAGGDAEGAGDGHNACALPQHNQVLAADAAAAGTSNVQQQLQQQQQQGVDAGVDSSHPEHMEVEGGTAAAATAAAAAAGAANEVAAAAGCGVADMECGLDAASCLTPARQRCKGAPGFTPMPPPQQPLATHAAPPAAAAAAAAAAGGHPPAGKASTAKKSGARPATKPSTGKGVRGNNKGFAATGSARKVSGGLRQLTLAEQLAAAAAKAKQTPLQPAAAVAAAAPAAGVEGSAAAQQQDARHQAGGETNSAVAAAALLSKQVVPPVDAGTGLAPAAAAAAAAGAARRAGNAAGGAAQLLSPTSSRGRQAGGVGGMFGALSIPWSLQRQMQQTHIHDMYTQGRPLLQQQQQLMDVSGGPCSGRGGEGCSRGGGGSSAVRLLHDEFEVFCDDDSQAAAAAVQASAVAAAAAEEKQGPAHVQTGAGVAGQMPAVVADASGRVGAGGSSSGVGLKAARRLLGVAVSQTSASAAAAGDSAALLLSPSCQENNWLAATVGAAAAAAAGIGVLAGAGDPAAAAAAGPHVCDSPMDVDMVPCSLPADPNSQLVSQQQQQQQQQQQDHHHPNHNQQQQQQHAAGLRPRVVCRFNSMRLPPNKVAEVLGVSRTPLGDLSPLLLLPHTVPTTLPAAAAGVGEDAGVESQDDGHGMRVESSGHLTLQGLGLRASSLSPGALGGVGKLTRAQCGVAAKASPVRVLNMGVGPAAAAGPASSGRAGGSQRVGGGASVLQMLGQGGPHHQQQQGSRGAAGVLLSGSHAHEHRHQQQQQWQQQWQPCGAGCGQQFLSPQRQQCSMRRPCSPLKPKHIGPDGCAAGPAAAAAGCSGACGQQQQQQVSSEIGSGAHSSGDGLPRKRSRLCECTPEKVHPTEPHGLAWDQQQQQQQPQHPARRASFSERLAAAAAAADQGERQVVQQHVQNEGQCDPHGNAMPAAHTAGAAHGADRRANDRRDQHCADQGRAEKGLQEGVMGIGPEQQQQQQTVKAASGVPSFFARRTAALQEQFHQRWQQQHQEDTDAAEEGCGEAGEAPLPPAAAAAVDGGVSAPYVNSGRGGCGGMRRAAAIPGSNRKRQCRLADLWAAKQPEVEDGESRFSGY